jgi:hypothetical protein
MYRVRFKEGNATVGEVPYQVERSAVESDLRMLDDEQRESLATACGVKFDETVVAEPTVAVAAPRREPVWGILLSALVALLVAELFLANLIARQRHGFEAGAA